MRYEVRPGGRSFRDVWFFTVFDEDGEERFTGGATSEEDCHRAAREALKRLRNPTTSTRLRAQETP